MNDNVVAPSGNSREVQSSVDGHSLFGQVQTTHKIQLLRTGSLVFGVFEDEIASIEEWRQPAQLPHAPAAVLGVVAIRGRILTTLNPAALIDEISAHDNSALRRIVALRGDEQVALAIEDKGEVVELPVKDIQQSELAGGVVLGTFRNQGQIVSLLDIRGLFPAAIKGRGRRHRHL